MNTSNEILSVMRISANRAAKSMRAALSSKIREKYNIRKQHLDSKLKIVPASRNAEPLLIISSRRIGLYKFGGRQTRKGASAAITKRGRKVYRRSWITNVAAGSDGTHTGIFYRLTKKRYPIAELYAVTELQLAYNKVTSQLIVDRYAERFGKEFTGHIQHRIGTIIAAGTRKVLTS